ncbi:hypothetical protein DDE74_20810 [Streptomyces lydicus]|uniref:Right handed beta helix domain-containing protein n=1 Tax=Streptomyces lydicus TaxID=47763 RepID=A0A3Q9KAW3_9ACTN|nr:hypothetical protein [Streptomyces lydicus]AZS73079.1 hypothetical protein DDE74_20810 [Streptomyces lydicus]
MFRLRALAGFAVAAAAVTTATAIPATATSQDLVPCSELALREAIDQANQNPDAGILKLTPHCVYTLTDDDPNNPGTGLVITTEITIYGNDSTIERSTQPPTPDFRIFRIAPGGDLTLKHLTVRGGRAQGDGGGILLSASSAKLTLIKTRLTKNSATASGGGIANGDFFGSGGGAVTVRDSDLQHNSARFGGGMAHFGGTARFWHSRVTGNTAASTAGGIIADVRLGTGGTLTLNDSKVTDNTAFDHAGGIDNHVTTTLNNTLVRGNRVTGPRDLGRGGTGGGIVNHEGTLALNKSAVVANKAIGPGGQGGGLAIFVGTATLTDSRVIDNIADKAPGGIYRTGGTVTLQNTNVKKNHPTNCADSTPPVDGCLG